MAQLRQDYARFIEQETEVVAVGPDDADAFRQYWQENDLPYRGIPDPDHQILKLYGQQFRLLKLGRMPGEMVIDKRGRLRFVHYAADMADIPDNEAILEVLDRINKEMDLVAA